MAGYVQQSKAQSSVEILLILSAVLVIFTIISLLAQEQINTVQREKNTMDAENSLLSLSSAAREVYAQGEGSKKYVFIQLPSAYEPDESTVGNKSIRIREAGSDHVSIENFDVHGRLPGTSGGHWIWVVSEGNRVRIGDAMLELNRNRIYVVMNSNSTESQSVEITNIWSNGITVATTTTWTASAVTMSGVPVSFNLDPDEALQVDVEFTADETSGGLYTGEIELNANDGQGATESVDIPVTVQVIRPGEETPTEDIVGPVITSIYQDPAPAVKLQPLMIYVEASDELTGGNTISGCEIDADNVGNWQMMLPEDGAYDEEVELSSFNYTAGFALGPHTIRARCTDSENNTGAVGYYYFNVTEADQLGPIVIQMEHTEYPTTLSNVTVWGIATDAYTGNSNLQGCNVQVDAGFWVPITATDGAWDSPTENFTYDIGTLDVGTHTISYQCTDVLGNIGGIYEDSFGIVDVDLMIVLDRSGSMAWNVTNATSSSTVSASSTGWSWVKNLTVSQKNGDLANLSTEIKASASGCTASYRATINANEVATGNRTSTSYGTVTASINVSDYEPPYQVALWLKRDASGCTASGRSFSLQQAPTKLYTVKESAKSFLDIAGSDIQAGLVSYSTSATTDRTLALMSAANQLALKNAIDGLVSTSSTCIECGLENAANELTSARGRSAANKVVILLTDGVSNVGDSVTGAVYCRDRNVTVYTIGFGDDVDETELTNIALLTHGDYYYAPNAETLTNIFMNIGKH